LLLASPPRHHCHEDSSQRAVDAAVMLFFSGLSTSAELSRTVVIPRPLTYSSSGYGHAHIRSSSGIGTSHDDDLYHVLKSRPSRKSTARAVPGAE